MKTTPPKTALLLVFLTVFIDLLGFGIVLPLVPIYTKQLGAAHHMDHAQVTRTLVVIMISFSVMQFIFAPLWGRLSDRVGRRPILLLSLAGSTSFYALFGLSMQWGSLTSLMIARIGAGIAGATIPTAQAYIADCTTRQNRTRGMALIGAAFGLGFTFGPLIGALALTGSDPRALGISPWPGFAAAILSGSALLLAIFKLPESLSPESSREARKHFDLAAFRDALMIPSMGLLLLASFLGVLALANLESTLSLTIESILKWGSRTAGAAGEAITVDARQIFLVFSYIGFVQSIIQGGLVRRLAKTMSEVKLAVIGTLLACAGYVLLACVTNPKWGGLGWLMTALAVVISGISFVVPAIQSLISRRIDPTEQGGILGLGDSISTLARIAGVYFGITLLRMRPDIPSIPFWSAAGLMLVVMLLVTVAAARGKDFVDRPTAD